MRTIELRIDPALWIRAGTDRSLGSIDEAVEFLSTWAGRRPGPDWGEVLFLLENVQSQEQVMSATAALRALLECHALLMESAPDPTYDPRLADTIR